jgi:arginine decarboxylase
MRKPPRELPRRWQHKEELFTLFNPGTRRWRTAQGDSLLAHLRAHPQDLKILMKSEEFEDMEKMLADTYVMNFSVFQSLPDSWATTSSSRSS